MSWWKKIGLGVVVLLASTYVGSIGFAFWPHAEAPVDSLARPGDAFATVDGNQLRYRRWGDHDDQPTVMFLHGFGGSLNAFTQVGEILGESVNVVAVDLMPFGLSDKPVDYDYKFRNQARTISKLADELEIEELVIAGHSYGGTVAAYMAATMPNVKKLVLIDPGIQSTGVPAFVRYMTFPFRRMGAKMFTGRDFRRKFVAKSFEAPDLVDDDFVDELMLSTQMEGYMDGMTSFFSQYMDVEVQWLFDNIKVPTLLIWAKQDKRNKPAYGREMDAALADSRLVLIDQSGHYPHMEQPQAVSDAVREFAHRKPAEAPPVADAPNEGEGAPKGAPGDKQDGVQAAEGNQGGARLAPRAAELIKQASDVAAKP